MSEKTPKGDDRPRPEPIETESEYRKDPKMSEKSTHRDQQGDRSGKDRKDQ